MSTSVKHISNDMRGAPQISGTVGTLLAALDALFTTGWGITTALSVNVVGGVATATLNSGETFFRDSVVLVAGATPAALNGEARVLSTSSTSITWATAAPDGVATGAITIKYAPQTSWTKVHGAANKGAYRSSHVQSRGHYLAVDDTGTTAARVRGYETMSDMVTGTGPFPTEAQMSGGGYWYKSVSANATAVRYRIFCDERFFILAIAAGYSSAVGNTAAPARGFGDPIELAQSGDAWITLLSIGGAALQAGDGSFDFSSTSAGNGQIVSPRALSALGGAVQMGAQAYTGSGTSGSNTTLGTFPSEVDGQAKTSKVFVRENVLGKPPRAVVPGLYFIPQSAVKAGLQDGDTLVGVGDLAGRRLLVVQNNPAGIYAFANPDGVYLIDITGPWR